MRYFKRITALLLVLVMCLAYTPAPAHAVTLSELKAVNGTVELDGTNPGTVTVAITAPGSIGIVALDGLWGLKENEGTNYLTLTELGSDKITFTGGAVDEASAETGNVLWFDTNMVPAEFEAGERILYATYTVAADTPAGEYTVTFDTDAIQDGNFADVQNDFTFKITVTRASAPACDHEGKEYTYQTNSDGTHKVICACGEIVNASEICSGGTADCENPAQCQFCKTAYGEALGHRDGDDNNHDCDYCDEKNIEGHTEATREESASEGNCEEAETFVEVTFCTECGEELGRGEPYAKDDASGHSWGTVTYNWSTDYSDCTASRTCRIESCGKEETEKVKTTSVITTTGSCTVKEVVTYTADFTSAWAVDQEKEVTGDYVHDGSCEECAPAELVAVDGTVTLDGTNPGTVTVAISTTGSIGIVAVDGLWGLKENEGTNYLTLTELGSDNIIFTGGMLDEASAETGNVLWFDIGMESVAFEKGEKILYATYTVAADTPAGEYTVTFDNDAIQDDTSASVVNDFTCKITVVVEIPACDHEGKEYTYEDNGNGTHKVICPCGEIVEAAEECSGGSATCNAEAKCTLCEAEYGDYADHEYGQLIPVTEAVHTQDELKAGVAEHYQCAVCNAYFTGEKVETTLDELKGETPVHVEETKTETTEATCDQDGKVETVIFCSVCGLEISRETTETIPAGHTWGDASYKWSDDCASCEASRTCQVETCGKEETEKVNTSSEITTAGSCTVKEVVSYTADFTSAWAVDQEKEVTGDYVHDGSCEECAPAELVAVDGTVTLDGTNPGTVTVAISTTGSIGIVALDGMWGLKENEGTNYLTLTELGSDNIIFTGGLLDEASAETGNVLWFDISTESVAFEKGESILYATYTVAADTPAGEYTVTFDNDAIQDSAFAAVKDDFTFKITVVVEIPACDHEGKEYTCKDNGDGTHTVTCECGGIVDAEAAHSFITEVTRTEANCTEAGSVTKQCECGATETTELPVNADNHTGVNHTEKVKEATCTAEGYTGDTVCECGVTVKYGEAIEKKAHEFTVEQSKTLATCKEEGFIIWKCANCDATETETLAVDAANHTGVNHIENAKEATCTAEGYTGDTVCECGVTVADGEIIKMADHSFTVEQSKTEATCVAEGSILWKCANCDATETETLDMDPANHASEEFIYSDNEDGETHTKAHACCETVIDEEEAHVYVDGECVCGAVEPVKAITVIEKGGVEYEVVDNVVTVTRDDACKVGYWDAKNNKYVVIEAQPNEDGSYSFVAPEGVTEVLVVVKGDVNGDGKLNVRDITALSKSQLTETNENYAGLDEAWQQFAADVNGDGKLNVRDITALSKSQLTETNENYAALPW